MRRKVLAAFGTRHEAVTIARAERHLGLASKTLISAKRSRTLRSQGPLHSSPNESSSSGIASREGEEHVGPRGLSRRNLAAEPFLSNVLLGGQTLLLAGSESQQAEWLAPMVEGEKLLALAYQGA